MELRIQLVCPRCDESMSLHIEDLAPGHRPLCQQCQTPGRLTPDSLERFSRELHLYCKA
ncbi:MAG: hypothetical protein JRE16_00670 [Deltaproteobacteria bacterium]|nr:hypothetical protein [Deltaproteobacteria bacterium]MBW2503060.1 hypothetical protein [Deltaproteobacteria bacterium]